MKPEAPDPALVTGRSDPFALWAPPITRPATSLPEHLPPAVDETGAVLSGETAGALGSAARAATLVSHDATPTSVTPPPVSRSAQSRQPVPGDDALHGTAKKRVTRPRAARVRTTIQLDPLEAPVDSRRARVTVGALIDDLERAKLRRPT